jgi:hypothetical protein
MDGFFGKKPPHVSARNTALFGTVLTVLIYFVAFFQNDDTGPLWKSLRVLLPTALFFLGCFAFVAYSLRRKPEEKGLAMGIAFPTTVILLFLYSVVDSYVHGSSETQMGIVYSFLFFFTSPAWALFLWLMIPTLLRLMYKSVRASLGVTRARPHLGALAGFALLSLAGYQSAWNMVHSYDSDTGPYYRSDQTAETIEPLYLCLWSVGNDARGSRGFPDSLSALRTAGAAARGVNCGKTLDRIPDRAYTVDYARPSKDQFLLTLVEKTRSGSPVHKLWVDQTGVVREAVDVEGKLDSVRVVNAAPLADLLVAQHRLEDYAVRNSGHEYPVRLSDAYSERRHMVYTPRRSVGGKVTSYTLLIPSSRRLALGPITTRLGESFRSYLLDETGAVHARGGNLDATRTDPPPPADELTAARDRLNGLKPVRLDHQQRQAQWDSLSQYKLDSTRRDSVRRSWHATRDLMRAE